MQAKFPNQGLTSILSDRQIFEISPFLTELVSGGSLKELKIKGDVDDDFSFSLAFKDFRKQIRKAADDPETALLYLRNFRIRTLLEIVRADLENRLKP
ncbi:MAG: hypothetical protein JRI34_06305, partial [Deltaproteobacteria bacterium]|nr:hypothetical protein [Deltaproteobacteria bacterium]